MHFANTPEIDEVKSRYFDESMTSVVSDNRQPARYSDLSAATPFLCFQLLIQMKGTGSTPNATPDKKGEAMYTHSGNNHSGLGS